jgi:hypothetical protein
MTKRQARAHWASVREAAAMAAALAEEIDGDLETAAFRNGRMLLPVGTETRLAQFDDAVQLLASLKS